MTDISLQKFCSAVKDLIADFEQDHIKRNKGDPVGYPLQMPEDEWCEEFTVFIRDHMM